MVAWTLTGQRSLLSVLGSNLQKIRRESWIRFVAGLKILARVCLVVAAFAAFTVAGWMVAMPLGLVVLGVSLLGFEWLIKSDREVRR